ncbi:type VI secretion system-associated FHA domain protein TagH [Roseibium sp. Sym1]|uniref:type VI secretion system-associated FHA domain protein TagH n=1 Tax=Roseibium sp. Sym1 TaxID=3016006 RepID=UPI0022B37955|nr:type VI secretion system-associated FHA domain protein TagH [Roseibium sp. Sym1]
MRITLQIENVDRLESGGQLSYSCADRGFDIGRHEHLDWSLPDPQRVISGKHCEVRFEGGQFVLYDFSTNGTFLNGSQTRMDKAHVLRSGDRVMIGDYIIAVSLENSAARDQGSSASAVAPAPYQQGQPWNAPQPEAVGAGSAWPSGPGPAAPQAPYPSEPAGGPWATPGAGFEGPHAPPSRDAGIGTPADDVWSQQGHGWGNADPALYDPKAQQPDREPARPSQADPLDHLAQQPDLHREPVSTAGQPGAFPPAAGEGPGATPEPMFQMPDLEPAASPQQAEPAFEPGGVPEQEGSSVSEAPVWPGDDTASSITPEAPAATPAPAVSVEKVSPQIAAEPSMPPVPPASEPGSPQGDTGQPVAGDAIDFLKAFAEGAGLPPDALRDRDPEEFARELGTVLNGIAGDLMGLLQARSQVKAMTRNANRTLIARTGNNALKFSPTPQMALQTMLSQRAEEDGYLPLPKAMSAAFKDIQKHHVWTYAAMQKAAARFDETLSPTAIEAEGQVAKSTFGNQKAKLWERLEERWTSLTKSYDDGLVGVFTQYFTESYEEMSKDDPGAIPGGFD